MEMKKRLRAAIRGLYSRCLVSIYFCACGGARLTICSIGRFTDPAKVSEDLQAFAKLNESRLYKLLSTCLDPQVDLKTLVKSSVSLPALSYTHQNVLT